MSVGYIVHVYVYRLQCMSLLCYGIITSDYVLHMSLG